MNLAGWMPARVAWGESAPRVEWTLMGGRRLVEPFFDQTLQAQMAHPFHQLFRRDTSLDDLVAWTNDHPGVPLSGIVFHMSRCGSTLLAQQLASHPSHIVASEAAPIDAILRAHQRLPEVPRERQIGWLRALVSGLGQARAGEQRLYLKMDCWHVRFIERVREAFPAVPWVFLYRDPLEVLVSLKRVPAAWTVPGLLAPEALGLGAGDWDPTQTEVYAARALEGMCSAALEAMERGPQGMLVNYRDLPGITTAELLEHFNLPADGVEAMRRVAQHHSKSPGMAFGGDSASKQASASATLREVVRQYLEPVYRRLEARRRPT